MSAHPVTLVVFFALFAVVAALGLLGSRWRAADLSQLAEWGLGGRRFGTVITWFLMGGDLYTAYTFIAVPALMFGAGAAGFFAIPYATLMYPLLFLFFPRLWSVARRHGYVTAADFVRGRFGNRPLALAVALTGIVATMPYIALQLMGMQVVIAALGLNYTVALPLLGSVSLPLIAAFIVLAAYTYNSGLRGTALVAVVKDMLVYATVLAAIIIIPSELGGYGKVFASVDPKLLILGHGTANNLGPGFAYVSLCIGSTLALFMYPHAVTGLLSASSRHVVKRNSMILPAYSVALALVALLGYMAIAAGVKAMPAYAAGLRQLRQQFRRARAVPAHVPGLVCRRGIRRHRHRRAGARLDDGNRLRQSFQPQYLQGFHKPGLHPGRGIARCQTDLAGSQAGSVDLCAGVADHLCHPASVTGRHLDLPDRTGGHAGAVCAAQSLGASGGMGGRDDGGHLYGLDLGL